MAPRILNVILIILISSFLLLIESCKENVKPEHTVKVTVGYIQDDKDSAEQEIEKFHSRFNSGDYEAIYNNAVQGSQKSQHQTDLSKFLKGERDSFGDFVSVIDKRINVIMGAPVQIRAAYISKFSKTDVTERFMFVHDGDMIRLALYQPSKGRTKLPPLENK